MPLLTTINNLKAYIGHDGSDDDVLMESVLAGVSDRMVRAMPRFDFQTTRTSEPHGSFGYPAIVIDHPPIISVTTPYAG